jgi:hypothetical protein
MNTGHPSAAGALPSPLSTFALAVRWTRITFYGWSLGFALILAFIAVSSMIGLGDSQFPVGLGMGVGVGLLQRRIVAERRATAAGWLGASALGLTIPFLARDVAKLLAVKLPYALNGSIVVGGLIVGLLQWRALRLTATRGSSWALATLIGWTLGGSTVVLNEKLPKTPGIPGALIYIGIVLTGGILLGATTGLLLPWIMPVIDDRARSSPAIAV